jgi:superfamily II DNA or RNA helicase
MSSIIDNRDGNTLLHGLQQMSAGGQVLRVATAFFSLDALMMLADTIGDYDQIRILFGDDANPEQRRRLLEMLRQRSDADLLTQRDTLPNLTPLKKIEALFLAGKVEARCYTAKKFHAKAYLIDRPNNYPKQMAVIGSGNFTRPGLVQNIELNVELTPEQTAHLDAWFDARWAEAVQDVVTEDVLAEIRRQIDLYEPYVLYLKALYAWGAMQEADTPAMGRTKLLDALDPHQEQGFRRAVRILEQQHGVMVCDGVGLGKSFIALALMEYFCRQGQNVLLVAPKSIMDSSWNGYLKSFLSRYRQPFGSIFEVPMTELGFDPIGNADEETPQQLQEKRELVHRLFERADVLVVDESHNFRASSASRYKNLMEIVKPYRGRKRVILLTATPINTAYRDISTQLALVTHDAGNIAGYSIDQIKKYANLLDKDRPSESPEGQMTLGLMDTPSEALNRVLESVVIQRSRATVKALAQAKGKVVHFPKRTAPQCIEVTIKPESALYRDLIGLAQRRFQPGVEFLRRMREEIAKAEKSGKAPSPVKMIKSAPKGLKLAAFLLEQYRRAPAEGRKTYQDEVHLAALVFANTLKQLESSPVAFQGILQSLGTGLIARLQYVFGEAAQSHIAEHESWVRTPLFPKPEAEGDTEPNIDIEEDGDNLDASGDETDAWLAQAVKSRHLAKKLTGFNEEAFDVNRWRDDIVADLHYLKEIHEATLSARSQPDPKLADVLPEIKSLLADGRRVLLFTQSQRTAEYLEKELRARLGVFTVARIDSRVEKTRAAILYAFCPGYNPPAHAPSIPAHLDVLISTDVLSEGVNLQEAGAIFSYDIHWNPVRLIQRIGRVDRRLDPEITPHDHAFAIVNVLPADEINDIINLVGAVENRTLRISNALGLDVSFFKSDDPAGNLKEFNSTYEGEITQTDQALNEYARLSVEPPDEKTQRILAAIPPGAFGVWANAPQDGLFALFTMEPKPSATAADRERFAAVIGKPVLILERPGKEPLSDAGTILTLLAKTIPDAPSGVPSDESQLALRLKKLKEAVRRQFTEISLPASILPRLVCWMELRKGNS